ncbi:MAG: Gfo/Idh/MocA family oxidoreductase [Gemmatimonadota bacterium]
MSKVLEKLNVAVVGACRRGASFKAGLGACPEVRAHAVCDIDPEGLAQAAAAFGAAEKYTDYEQMLARSDLDAVVIATPMHLHATQAIMALERGLHVLSEVTAAISLDECRRLVTAARTSAGTYMLAENCNYFTTNVLVRELVRAGLLGTCYFAEGEYLHNVKELSEKTPWRRRWALGIDGITYGTHSLGPILSWMAGDRVARVCCAGSGHHYTDPRGEPYHQDTHLMLGQMALGGLVKVRVDMVSERPYVTCTYQLQGTQGCYESSRSRDDHHRVWLRDRCPDAETWMDLNALEEEFLPEWWRQGMERARGAGHGGSDYFVALAFVEAALGRAPAAIGIHEAMDMTLPGLLSQQSSSQQGRWLEVPDSREW